MHSSDLCPEPPNRRESALVACREYSSLSVLNDRSEGLTYFVFVRHTRIVQERSHYEESSGYTFLPEYGCYNIVLLPEAIIELEKQGILLERLTGFQAAQQITDIYWLIKSAEECPNPS